MGKGKGKRKQERFACGYRGVYYINGISPIDRKPEKIYYIEYRRNGKRFEEKAGRQFIDDMTPARANNLRSAKILGHEPSNQEKRERIKAEKTAEAGKWTMDRLWEEYKAHKSVNKGFKTDDGRYGLYLKEPFGAKEPHEIAMLDVDRVRINLMKTKSAQTVKHVLNLLQRIVNFGVTRRLCEPLSFRIQKPRVNNIRTEFLTSEQLKALLKAIDADENIQAGNMMKMALFTGMRRGELFKLRWEDVDFERGFIYIRDPKGGQDQVIPLNDAARKLLETHPKKSVEIDSRKTESEYVFPGRSGKERTDIAHQVRRIKEAAGLPKDFRPLHGLRHTYASMLVSNGQDLYTVQHLLTHKDPRMTQRYSHLRDETLRRASNQVEGVIAEALKPKEEKKGKVVNITEKKS
jgi:integrase